MSLALPYRTRPKSRWRRLAASPVVRALVIVVTFATLLTVGVQSARDLAAMLGAAMSRSASIGGSGAGNGRAATQPVAPISADPVMRFLETRVGHLLFSMTDGNTCRRVLFDNRTGEATEVGRVECGFLTEAQNEALRQEQARERTQQVLKSFRR